MAQTSAGRSPIPPANKEDSEDVAWALSTAEAMHARGDAVEALKWLRRAAEAAAESSADDRALQIAKAAADLASVVGPTSHMPPPPPAPVAPVIPKSAAVPGAASPPARPIQQSQPTQQSRQAAAPAARPSAPATAAGPAHAPTAAAGPAPAPTQATPRAPAVTPKAPPARPAAGSSPGAARRTSGGRRSRPDVVISRPPDEETQQMEVSHPAASPAPSPAPAPGPTATARRRGRASRPAPEEATGTDASIPMRQQLADTSPLTPIDRGVAAAAGAVPPATPSTDDMDAWPTQAMGGAALEAASVGDEKTRIGVPAYQPEAAAPTPAAPEEPALQASQAVRVIVWRTAEGVVRIAPAGTSVSAISVEAVLVALDPNADLAAWLTGK